MSKLSRAVRGHRDLLLLAALFLVIAGCGGNGCGGCGTAPLPGGALPLDQTIEGGAQVRLTPSGFAKFEGIAAGLVEDALDDGVCVSRDTLGPAEYCYRNDGVCAPGCQVDLALDSVELTPEPGRLRVSAQVDVDTVISVRVPLPIVPDITCSLTVRGDNTVIEALVAVGTDAATGEVRLSLTDIPVFQFDPDISGCVGVGAILDALDELFGVIQDAVLAQLEPQLADLIANFLPDPLGVENVVDLTALLGSISPGTSAAIELRAVPGGYAQVERGGLSLGVISGINADRNPATRSRALDSEPALCVPQIAAPNLTGRLPASPRGSFSLAPANAFRGLPEPGGDLLVGLSESFLDLAGHHAVTSGALCLRVGTEQIEQLTLGILGIVVPSLAELGSPEGDDPVLLVLRPEQAVDFDIGSGTEESPSIGVHVRGLQIDFNAFLFERYVRGFTVSVDIDVGVNLEFGTDDDGNPFILPVLVGLDAQNIGITVLNAEFLREDKAQLEALLPAVVAVALPLLTDVLPEIDIPEFLGFRLDSLSLSKVTTSQDDFLAISATLAPSQTLARQAEHSPALAQFNQRLAAAALPAAPRALVPAGSARLVRVATPPPDAIRAHLMGQGGAMPEVVIEVPQRDRLGRELEWTWNLGGGMWRPFRRGGTLVLADQAFALQGRYEVQLRSRVVGDYRTLSADTEVLPIVIDSVAPRILGERAAAEGDDVLVPAVDLVSPADRVQLAFGRVGDDAPTTAWASGRISLALASELAGPAPGAGGESSRVIRAWARDELGNQSTALVDLGAMLQPHDQGTMSAGCAVRAGGSASGEAAGGTALFALAALVALGCGRARRRQSRQERRPRRRLLWPGRALLLFVAAGALASQPACGGGGNKGDEGGAVGDGSGGDDDGTDGSAGQACIADADCDGLCAAGTVSLCSDDVCVCADEVPWGRIGQYSAMDVAADGTAWVSAYNSTHGDLMVASTTATGRIPDDAWQFVDGVPDGPVVVPGGTVRGGINAPGPDVGLYTDIAVAPDGAAMVSYFDLDTGSLRFASNRSGAWSTHVVDQGAPATGQGSSFEIDGQYSAITVRADGRPGIAYFVHLSQGGNERTELRFAEAGVPDPAQASDWTVNVIDGAAVPQPGSDPLPIPMGVGLFVDAARLSDGSPVVVYYDRINGDLKSARYVQATSSFAPPVLESGVGADIGWYPSVSVDADDELHISCVNRSRDDLIYIDLSVPRAELIDDGYREVGTTDGGVPLPEFHFVGDDSSLVLGAARPIVVYQDATSHELLVARRQAANVWQREVLAGNEDPFVGGYGFYISARIAGDELVISSWVIDQPHRAAWVEILRDSP